MSFVPRMSLNQISGRFSAQFVPRKQLLVLSLWKLESFWIAQRVPLASKEQFWLSIDLCQYWHFSSSTQDHFHLPLGLPRPHSLLPPRFGIRTPRRHLRSPPPRLHPLQTERWGEEWCFVGFSRYLHLQDRYWCENLLGPLERDYFGLLIYCCLLCCNRKFLRSWRPC